MNSFVIQLRIYRDVIIHEPFISNTYFTKSGTGQEGMQAVAVLHGEEDITSLGEIPKLLLSRN